ncbi:MAG: GNAT family N-acetyltransferase [Sporichthyaceae bacterium]
MTFSIRDADAADWPAIWPFLRQIMATGETYTVERAVAEDDARSWWLRPQARVFAAVDADGTVIGTAKLMRNFDGPSAHVANASFLVDPAHAGRGIGRALGEHVLEAARVQGYRAMQFNSVVESNTAAVALWRSLGFAILATVPDAFEHPRLGLVGLHIMHRAL